MEQVGFSYPAGRRSGYIRMVCDDAAISDETSHNHAMVLSSRGTAPIVSNMTKLLVINASARVTRSVTRSLTMRFTQQWQTSHPEGDVVIRDVGQQSPPVISEPWIAAAYAEPEVHDEAMQTAIAVSNELIDELLAADVVVIGTPIYNFGIPAHLKAWIDQIVRVKRTFDIDPQSDNPYIPLIASRPVVVLTSAGDIEMHPGGAMQAMNFMEPYLKTVLGFVGLTDLHFVRIGNEAYKDARHQESMQAALAEIDSLAARLPSAG